MTEAEFLRFEGYVQDWCEYHAIRVELARGWNAYGKTIGVIITDFYADEPGNGVGSETMAFLIEAAEEMSVSLHLCPESPRAKEFFERHGFISHCRFGQFMAWLPPVPVDCEFMVESPLAAAA